MNNDVLHQCLLQDSLLVEVIDLDIRRSIESDSSLGLGKAPIETDYIFQVKCMSHGEGKQPLRELEKFSVSKRYVDVRSLAYTLHSYAEEAVVFFAKSILSNSKSANTIEYKSKKALRRIEKLFQKPLDALHYITNTESNSSDLVGELDSFIARDQYVSEKATRRTSTMLNAGAPRYLIETLDAIDEFYEVILSEKRQFGMKSSYKYVLLVAERRKALMNKAFSSFIAGLSRAQIGTMILNRSSTVPPVLERIIISFETFLLTDVVLEHDAQDRFNSPERSSFAQDTNDLCTSVYPKSFRRRASQVDRVKEQKTCAETNECIVMENEEHASDSVTHVRGLKLTMLNDEKLLPDSHIEFGIIVGIGILLFKFVENYEMNIKLDAIASFGLSCVLIGYHMSQVLSAACNDSRSGSSTVENSQQLTSTQSLTSYPASARKLIRASISKFRDGETSAILNTPQIFAAPTFSKFPDGATIGSHQNCWSSPAGNDFFVRGGDYLNDKMKVASGEFLFSCRGCDLFLTDNAPTNMGRNASILGGKIRDVPTFIVNYRLPWGVFISYHEIPKKFIPFLRRGSGFGDTSTPLPSLMSMTSGERAVCKFFLSDTEEKNSVWKIVPIIVEGHWVVKRVVGGKPAIVGTKLPISYIYQPPQPEFDFEEYFEADLDIVSSPAARNILSIVRSYTQSLTIDLGFVVQGNTTEELPEQMMLGLRLHGLDPLVAQVLPQSYDDIHAFEDEH